MKTEAGKSEDAPDPTVPAEAAAADAEADVLADGKYAGEELVPVGEATGPADAACLVALLEGAGIPALAHGDADPFHGVTWSRQQIMVPASFQDRGRQIIEAARHAAAYRGVTEAFQAHSTEDAGEEAKRDPLMARMLELAGLPLDDRLPHLRKHLSEWEESAVERSTMAHYLAAAGIKESMARKLMAETRAKSGWHTFALGTLLILVVGVGVTASLGYLYTDVAAWALLCLAVVYLTGWTLSQVRRYRQSVKSRPADADPE